MKGLNSRGVVVGAGIAVLALAGLGAAIAGFRPWPQRVVAPAPELKWHQLVPPAPPKPPRSFLANRTASQVAPPSSLGGPAAEADIGAINALPDGSPAGTAQAEGRWMSGSLKTGEAPAPVVAALDGKRVRIGGYVVSLDFEATRVKEFLLVPFVGACIHVPPPPANQIVYVKSEDGFEVTGMFDPVWVTGTLKTTTAQTGLAEAGYSLAAETVERRPPG